MGIPSYFKRITETVKGVIVNKLGISTAALLIDFNCIVYNCIRSDKLPVYSKENEEKWEQCLLEEICKTLLVLWKEAGSPPCVYIAVDGVVPMAKIKQQRMRRFKSVWWIEKEYEMGVRKPGEERWDTNAITPGTDFMRRLGRRLQTLCSARTNWTVSTSDEPGEGEHKIMSWIRAGNIQTEGNIVIYGLDADLILLSCLTSELYLDEKKNPCFLMRERGEFGSVQALGDYLFLSIPVLLESFTRGKPDRKKFLMDYICSMSFLGNDFLPHGIHLKIKDGGHDRILGFLDLFHSKGKFLIDGEKLNIEVVKEFLQDLAKTEEADFFAAIEKKRKIRPMNPRNDTERLMSPIQKLPLDWFKESIFLDGKHWQEVYKSFVPEEAVHEYMYGLQWIFDYYMGKDVNRFWFYPWHLPPLWKWLAETETFLPILVEEARPLIPEEQLALVLPMESWHLVQNKGLRMLPVVLPQYFPRAFGFETLGKYWMWECEANIPILMPGRMRSVVKL